MRPQNFSNATQGSNDAPDALIVESLRQLQAMLPARTIAKDLGDLRRNAYINSLRGHSRGQLAYMVEKACKTLEWFPTLKQCLELIAEYREPVDLRDDTLIEAQNRQAAFETWFANISDGQPIGDVEDRWIRIAIERGPIRRLEDGSLVLRVLYQGPRLPAPVKL